MTTLTLDTAKVFRPLLERSRYLAAHGGRGSGKSHMFAELMCERALMQRGFSAICIREVQKDLKHSNKRLLAKKIEKYGLERSGFRIFSDRIETPGDGVILFQGMQDHTAESIKSLEGMDVADIEEAHTLSDLSLQLLRPTIRAPGSEIWARWNPRRKTDPIDALLRQKRPDNAIVVQANWRDNPWWSPELEAERKLDEGTEEYEHIWEGAYVTVFKGAYYAQALKEARSEKRIGHVARDPLFALRAYWDIGGPTKKADAMAVWLAQFVGREIRVLAYKEGIGQQLGYYTRWLEEVGAGGCECILPHDGVAVHADNPTGKTLVAQLNEAHFRARHLPNQGAGAALQRIQTARRLWPRIWINEALCADGLEALGAYAPRIDDQGRDMGPEHGWASHGSDAWGLMCMDYREPAARIERLAVPNYAGV